MNSADQSQMQRDMELEVFGLQLNIYCCDLAKHHDETVTPDRMSTIEQDTMINMFELCNSQPQTQGDVCTFISVYGMDLVRQVLLPLWVKGEIKTSELAKTIHLLHKYRLQNLCPPVVLPTVTELPQVEATSEPIIELVD